MLHVAVLHTAVLRTARCSAAHCSLHVAVLLVAVLHAAHCSAAWCLLRTACCVLPVACGMVRVVCCMLSAPCCPLHVVRCTLSAACCMSHVAKHVARCLRHATRQVPPAQVRARHAARRGAVAVARRRARLVDCTRALRGTFGARHAARDSGDAPCNMQHAKGRAACNIQQAVQHRLTIVVAIGS